MRVDDNEHVRLHELRGFTSESLMGAFKEAEAISRGTKCRQYLFSVSLNPPAQERVAIEDFEEASERIEARLGLVGQPRAIVFHEKEGRRHAHCVWSRIDPATMRARPMSFFKTKLMGISRDLYLEHGWAMPRGIARTGPHDPSNFSLIEWQQAKRQGVDPRWTKEAVHACWSGLDTLAGFAGSLTERGFSLAKGDRRGIVILDHSGTVQALTRVLGLKTKELRARVGDGDELPTVAEVQTAIAARMTPTIRRHMDESRERFRVRAVRLDRDRDEMTRLHRAARDILDARQAEHWRAETLARAARQPKGLRALWLRITGRHRAVRAQDEADARATQKRHATERQGLVEKQHDARAVLQTGIKALRGQHAEELRELRKDIGRYLGLAPGQSADRQPGQSHAPTKYKS